MKIKCESCENFVPKEFTQEVENIYGKTNYETARVCNKCAAQQHSMHEMTFHRELHQLMLERNEQLKREKKELKKQKKKEKAEKTDE